MKKLLVPMVAFIIGFVGANAYAVCASNDINCFKVNGTQKYRVSKDGNTEIAGTLKVDGTSTLTGNVTASGYIGILSKTLTQLNAVTPGAAGQLAYCSNCTQASICVSSGTTTGAWVVIASTGPMPSKEHCE